MASNTSKNLSLATEPSRNIFPFFSLPRELRDCIYEECLDDHELKLECKIRLRACHVANGTLLTIGRQFREEYEERGGFTLTTADLEQRPLRQIQDADHFYLTAAKKTELELSDDCAFCYAIVTLPLPVSTMPSLRINLVASDEHLKSDRSWSHSAWVQKVLEQAKAMQRLSISIRSICPDDQKEYIRMRDVLNGNFWTKVPQLAALKVYSVYEDHEFDFDRTGQVVMEWSAETRKVELVDLDQKYAFEA